MARKSYKGKYTPINPHKYVGDSDNIVFRSLWERKLMLHCDTNPSVIKWNSEEKVVPYWSSVDKKMRRYFPDFMVKLKKRDGSVKVVMIEVKPFAETQPPVAPKRNTHKAKMRYVEQQMTYQRNQDKWAAAHALCEDNNIEFKVMTEYELGIAKRK
jgi:hypothetical protein